MGTPAWASRLVEAVADRAGREPPQVVWRRRDGYSSSGHHCAGRIVVTAGTDRHDARESLLHELAHWLNPRDNHGHDMYQTLFALVRWDGGVPMRYALERECAAYVQAGATAVAMGIRGARQAADDAARRRALRNARRPRQRSLRCYVPGVCPLARHGRPHRHVEGYTIQLADGSQYKSGDPVPWRPRREAAG